METESMSRQASRRQLAYIGRLQAELGVEEMEVSETLTSYEASQLITDLLDRKSGLNGSQVTVVAQPVAQAQTVRMRPINEPRLGLALKECFRLWTSKGWDIWNEDRESFKRSVRRTYDLFTEAAQAVEQGDSAAPKGA